MDNYCNIKKDNKKIIITVNIGNNKLDKKITDETIKQIAKITKRYSSKKEIEIITDLDLNSLYKHDNLRWSIVSSLNVAKIKDKNERLYKIYDAACKYLDNEFIDKNLCEFENDMCIEKRRYNITNGCCHKFKNRYLGPLLEDISNNVCEYQKDKQCIADCLGCKLFVCDTVKNKKGIYFNTKNVSLIRYYFNIIQKIIIETTVFSHKDKVLRLLKIFSF